MDGYAPLTQVVLYQCIHLNMNPSPEDVKAQIQLLLKKSKHARLLAQFKSYYFLVMHLIVESGQYVMPILAASLSLAISRDTLSNSRATAWTTFAVTLVSPTLKIIGQRMDFKELWYRFSSIRKQLRIVSARLSFMKLLLVAHGPTHSDWYYSWIGWADGLLDYIPAQTSIQMELPQPFGPEPPIALPTRDVSVMAVCVLSDISAHVGDLDDGGAAQDAAIDVGVMGSVQGSAGSARVA